MKKIMTKTEFKERWESDTSGGGITYQDVANCAKNWGLCMNPMTMEMDLVLAKVLAACGIKDDRRDK